MKRKLHPISNETHPNKRRKTMQTKELTYEECNKKIKDAKQEIETQKDIIRKNRKLYIEKYTNEIIMNLKDGLVNEITLLEGTFKKGDFPADKYGIEEIEMEVRVGSCFEADGYNSLSKHYSIDEYDNHNNDITEMHLNQFFEDIDSRDLEWEECDGTKFGSDCYCDVICSI